MRLMWKLTLGYGALLGLTTLVVGTLITGWIEAVTLRTWEDTLRGSALLLREGLEPGGVDAPDVQERVTRLGGQLGLRVTVLRADGEVVADSVYEPAGLDSHANRPEILESGSRGEGRATRLSLASRERTKFQAMALRGAGGEVVGHVRLGLALSEVDRRQGEVVGFLVLGAAVGLAIAVVPALMFTKHVTEPLTRMIGAARGLARGDQQPALVVRTRDELGVLATTLNVMGRQLRERMETITADRNKMFAILASMVEGVVAVDRDAKVVHLNQVAGSLLGADPEASVGLRVWEVTRVREVPTVLTETLANPQATSTEVALSTLRASTTRGATRYLQLHAAPLRSGDGSLAGAMVVLHDVTELRRLEVIRQDFVANVSHELKTPLTAIQSLVETMQDDRDMPQEHRERFLGKVQNQAVRLSALVSDLLSLSRIESEHANFDWVQVDLREVVEEVVRAQGPRAEEKHIVLEAELPETPVQVRGDHEALRQIVGNLVSNALSYTPSEGKVTVRAFMLAGRGRVEVRDSGIGIAPEDQARIFERFYRVDKARSRAVGGTGLGLSIVKHLVLVHQGTVSVESAVGAGSTFAVELPLDGRGALGGGA